MLSILFSISEVNLIFTPFWINRTLNFHGLHHIKDLAIFLLVEKLLREFLNIIFQRSSPIHFRSALFAHSASVIWHI